MNNPYELAEIAYQQGYDKANKEWLDRIRKMRAEIETEYGQCSICKYDYFSESGGDWYEVGDVADILQTIDEYKYKTEGKN